MKDNNLALHEIIQIRIIKNNEDELTNIEGLAHCECCFRDLSKRESRQIILRLLEEKKCDIEYLKKQLNEIKDVK